jgi:UDP-glucose 4-epimerase
MYSDEMSVVITGGAGFIGSHLAEVFLREGVRVIAVDDLSTGSRANISHLMGHTHFRFVHADINDRLVMDRLASEASLVVHLAAAVGVELIVKRPVHTIETNIMGTEAVLRAALRYGCRVLIASTSEVYGKGVRVPFEEDDDVVLGSTSRNRWAYAASKMIDEFLGLAYHREYQLPVVIARLFNTVGVRQTGHYGMVIPRLMKQALSGDRLTVYGDGTQRRCFCDVRDVVAALHGLCEHPGATGAVFNIGNTREVSILELAEMVREITKSSSEIALVPYEEAFGPGFEDMQRRVPSTARLQGLLGWEPKIPLEETLRAVRDAMTRIPA